MYKQELVKPLVFFAFAVKGNTFYDQYMTKSNMCAVIGELMKKMYLLFRVYRFVRVGEKKEFLKMPQRLHNLKDTLNVIKL